MLIIDRYLAKGHTEVETKLEKKLATPSMFHIGCPDSQVEAGCCWPCYSLFWNHQMPVSLFRRGCCKATRRHNSCYTRGISSSKLPLQQAYPALSQSPRCSIPILLFSNNEQILKLSPGTALVTLKIQLYALRIAMATSIKVDPTALKDGSHTLLQELKPACGP